MTDKIIIINTEENDDWLKQLPAGKAEKKALEDDMRKRGFLKDEEKDADVRKTNNK